MKAIALLATMLMVAGCGSASSQSPPAGGSEPAATVAHPPVATSTRPPSVFLESAAGKQEAVLGSYCVNGQLEGGCADSGPTHPQDLSVVHPGEEATLALESARVVRPKGCHAATEKACIGIITVRPLGCDQKVVTTVPLERGAMTRWSVGLDPGAYQLDVFAYFETDDGRRGDLSGTLGVLVDVGRKQEIVPADAEFRVCPFSD